eukprot:TRINITY_DN4483_c0_g1_i1.p1 TRINITY_DN4483_c0_g1~~TRINITY_DN4483_c0_g1_i1.p1  ORF type:complete len:294 (+),score=54.43 TRINITY_DN4483_c0_g1_i1:25-906(+)
MNKRMHDIEFNEDSPKRHQHELRKTESNISNLLEIFPQNNKNQIEEALSICNNLGEVSEYLLDNKKMPLINKNNKNKITNGNSGSNNKEDPFKELIKKTKMNENQTFELILFLNDKNNHKFIPRIEEFEIFYKSIEHSKIIEKPLSLPKENLSKKDVLPLDHGVMLLKNWLDVNEQMSLFFLSMEIAKSKNSQIQQTMNHNQVHPTALFTHNWYGSNDNKLAREPKELFELAKNLYSEAQKIEVTNKSPIMKNFPLNTTAPKILIPTLLTSTCFLTRGSWHSPKSGLLVGFVL